jgi:4-azaleucine resistance transporter AzlC
MFFITLLDQCYWVASAGLGAVVGSVLPFSTEGVDFVMTAMFTVIFLNQWEKDRQHYSALIGLAAPLACLILLLALRKPIEKAEGTEAEKSGEEVGA